MKFDAPLFLAGRRVVERLKEAGFAACFVGGAVRDLLAGYRPKDLDIVTTAFPEELARIFPDLQQVGASFGVQLLRSDGFSFELATAREERHYLDGRHPELVRYTRDLAVDVERRDFTINALLYDPVEEKLLDHVGGAADLDRGVVRTVGEPERRFGEDYLRMLRCVRFAARLGYRIDPAALAAIRRLAANCARLSPERVRVELTSMLTGPAPRRALELLAETGLLAVVLPEAAALHGVEQPPEFHPEGDVWTHTMAMLDHLRGADPVLAWSVLLHDIGKPSTQFRDANGRFRFFGHEARGGDLAEKILNRLRFSGRETGRIAGAVRDHMKFAQVAQMKPATRRRLLGAPDFPLAMELNRLDCVGSHGRLDAWLMLLDEVDALAGETALPAPLLAGRDLLAAGFTPGPAFGRTLKRLFDAQLAGEIATREEALKLAAEVLTSTPPGAAH